MTTRSFLALTGILAGFAAPALAGNADPAPQDAEIATPAVPPTPASPDWTGGYVGGQLGYGNVDTDTGADGDGAIGGLILGYDYDFGGWVLGGGLDYDFADIDVDGATTLENVLRLKLRSGVDLGNGGLLYGTGGFARADTSSLGDDDGWFLGAGYEHRITESFSVGGEALYHEFEDFEGSGIDVDATTLQVRGTFRF
ncbi:MAG: outer membrane protein [Paracoccaceae bacterium]